MQRNSGLNFAPSHRIIEQTMSCRGRPTFQYLGRCINDPFFIASDERSTPFLESSFAVVNLLSAAYQGNDHCPVLVSLHDPQEHLGF